jgi:Family of unknown function (DUF5317)
MLLGAILLLCFASVPLAGGSLARLSDLHFRLPGVAVGALALQILVIEVVPGGARWAVEGVHVASYALLAWFVWVNLRLPGLALVALGGALNGIAIAANHGVMPARPGAVHLAGLDPAPGEFVNSGIVAHPHLWWLGDVFAVPSGVPLANVFSVGDVLLLVGAAVLLHAVCGSRLARGRLLVSR